MSKHAKPIVKGFYDHPLDGYLQKRARMEFPELSPRHRAPCRHSRVHMGDCVDCGRPIRLGKAVT